MQDESIEMGWADHKQSKAFEIKEAKQDRNNWAVIATGLGGASSALIAVTMAMPKIPMMVVPTIGMDIIGAGLTCFAARQAIKAQRYFRELAK